jgi:hypothetical protein
LSEFLSAEYIPNILTLSLITGSTLIEVKQALRSFGATHVCPPMTAHGSPARSETLKDAALAPAIKLAAKKNDRRDAEKAILGNREG